jgi:RNA polymerase sigma factor (sigma-70 family)
MNMAVMEEYPPDNCNEQEDTSQPIEEWDFCELYDVYFDRVNRYLRCRVHHIWDADDLTTTVFLKALEKFHQYERRNPFASWIFRIAHNAFIDYLRKKREVPVDTQELVLQEPDETWDPEKQLLNNEQIQYLHMKLEQLNQDQRDVLTLRYFADLKISQVAEVLGKTE